MPLVLSPLCHDDPSIETLDGGVQGADTSYPLAKPFTESNSELAASIAYRPFFNHAAFRQAHCFGSMFD
jgi:hypothetical protein